MRRQFRRHEVFEEMKGGTITHYDTVNFRNGVFIGQAEKSSNIIGYVCIANFYGPNSQGFNFTQLRRINNIR